MGARGCKKSAVGVRRSAVGEQSTSNAVAPTADREEPPELRLTIVFGRENLPRLPLERQTT